jgi:hypothetical protein
VSKYNNSKYNGYDSKKEAKRAAELKLLEKAGEITSLQEQVPYELIPSQYRIVNGKRRCIERAMKYIADFQYVDKDGNTVVEDAKGYRTEVYRIKKKLMLYFHDIQIKEV